MTVVSGTVWPRYFGRLHLGEIRCVALGAAVAGGMVSIALIKALGQRTAAGKPIEFKDKPYHKGTIIGGASFGVGWAVTGACPGPIYAQIGSGEWLALTTLAGALSGAYVYALLKSRLPH